MSDRYGLLGFRHVPEPTDWDDERDEPFPVKPNRPMDDNRPSPAGYVCGICGEASHGPLCCACKIESSAYEADLVGNGVPSPEWQVCDFPGATPSC